MFRTTSASFVVTSLVLAGMIGCKEPVATPAPNNTQPKSANPSSFNGAFDSFDNQNLNDSSTNNGVGSFDSVNSGSTFDTPSQAESLTGDTTFSSSAGSNAGSIAGDSSTAASPGILQSFLDRLRGGGTDSFADTGLVSAEVSENSTSREINPAGSFQSCSYPAINNCEKKTGNFNCHVTVHKTPTGRPKCPYEFQTLILGSSEKCDAHSYARKRACEVAPDNYVTIKCNF